MNKILTIIVPSYNMEAYLPKCLGSLIIDDKGLLQKLDVIVVNDGSKDRTSEIAHEFEAKYPNVFRVIDKENGNYGSCINAALPIALGGYVKILDADDYVMTANFERYCYVVAEECAKGSLGADLIVTDYQTVDLDNVLGSVVDFGLTPLMFTLDQLPVDGERLTVHAITYNRNVFSTIGYRQSEGVSYSDTEWIIEPMCAVRGLRYVPGVVTLYLVGRDGQTMNPAEFARHFQQVMNITQGLILRYNEHLQRVVSSSREYYKRQILNMIRMVYSAVIFGWERHKVSGDLVKFDDVLREEPELYRWTEEFEIASRRFKFKYVKEWRRRKTTFTIRFMLFWLYATIVRQVSRMQNLRTR